MSLQILHIVVNQQPILEFDRGKPVPGLQRRYLDQMDAQMDAGITLENETVTDPDPLQRAQFVSNSLVNALFAENYSLATAMCTWLAKRMPDLKQVQAKGDPNSEQGIAIELIFDRDYKTTKQEQPIQFTGLQRRDKHETKENKKRIQ